MMGKVNMDKLNNFDPIRPERKADVKTDGQTPPIRPPRTESAGEKDRVAVSGKAAEVGKLVVQIKDLPEVRSEKVEFVRAQINAGEFYPTGSEIADAIFRDEQR